MTLRVRLMLIIGLSCSILWSVTSIWMFLGVRTQFRDTLDERLAASAHMVAGLVSQLPGKAGALSFESHKLFEPAAKDGLACEVRLRRGDLVARTQNSPEELGDAAAGYSTRTIQGERWRSYTLEQDGRRITAADRVDKRHALLGDIIFATVLPFVIAMLGSLLVLWFGIRRGLKPLESIRQAMASRKPDAVEPLPAGEVPAELAPLLQTINLLLDRTQRAIERERRFTGDAAHELRTPLTAVKTHIQVARLTAGDEHAASLQRAEQGLQRLQHTLEQLLMLARVEGPFFLDGEKTTKALEIAEAAIHEIAAEQRKRIVFEKTACAQEIAVPPMLMMTAIRNLLDNALRYSPEGEPVMFRLGEAQGMVRYSVRDHGPGLNMSDVERAAQRFWRKGSGQGSGLGLSIVDAIVKRFGGRLRLSADPEGGMLAEIEVPCVAACGKQAADGKGC